MSYIPGNALPLRQEIASKEEVILRLLEPSDADKLIDYFNNLSAASKRRFGPHSFEPTYVRELCQNLNHHHLLRLVATTKDNSRIIAYVLLLNGFLESDQKRYAQVQIQLNAETDATLAPSVADDYQSKGLGSLLMEQILLQSRKANKSRIILWGGVQATNEKAVNFYRKAGFVPIQEFTDHNGLNYDMLLKL